MALLSWKRVFLLIVAITVHNIPEGLAVGVGFGAIGKSTSATFESVRNHLKSFGTVFSSTSMIVLGSQFSVRHWNSELS